MGGRGVRDLGVSLGEYKKIYKISKNIVVIQQTNQSKRISPPFYSVTPCRVYAMVRVDEYGKLHLRNITKYNDKRELMFRIDLQQHKKLGAHVHFYVKNEYKEPTALSRGLSLLLEKVEKDIENRNEDTIL
ncbi:MAG: hypothetical protein LBC44_01135 [Mycoplasmataceae bacterium]|jgi:hypothetical protein|nr:hypothetical protein [Mycoplasmataceae bacterium]